MPTKSVSSLYFVSKNNVPYCEYNFNTATSLQASRGKLKRHYDTTISSTHITGTFLFYLCFGRMTNRKLIPQNGNFIS